MPKAEPGRTEPAQPWQRRSRAIRAGDVPAAAAKAVLSKALTPRHQRAQHEADKPLSSASVLSK